MRGDDHVVVSLEGDLSGTDLAQTVGGIHVEDAAQGTHLVAGPAVSFPQRCQSFERPKDGVKAVRDVIGNTCWKAAGRVSATEVVRENLELRCRLHLAFVQCGPVRMGRTTRHSAGGLVPLRLGTRSWATSSTHFSSCGQRGNPQSPGHWSVWNMES